MDVITADSVNEIYAQGLRHICSYGKLQPSRAGEVIALDCPLTVVYENPRNRVLFDPSRDANPFFHLFESLHMLAGRHDARWLDRFIHDFSARFAESDGIQHGAYGYRWRNHFDLEGGGHPELPDQLDGAVRLLTSNPHDRRVVIQMWDPVADLGQQKRDLPCNLVTLPRIRTDRQYDGYKWIESTVLDLTVFCRSGDFVWGSTGANAVHFSVLQEYLAGRIGVAVGHFTHIINNPHIYTDGLVKLNPPIVPVEYPEPTPMGEHWMVWDEDLRKFMLWVDTDHPDVLTEDYANSWFAQTAEPLYLAHWLWKRKERNEALVFLKTTDRHISPDWRKAAIWWLERRLARMSQKLEVVQG